MPKPPEPREGEIWDVQFSPTVGVEQAGVRPALVISNDWFNVTEHHLFIVAPITGTDKNLIYQVKIKGHEAGLSKNSVIMCEQIRSVDTRRFLKRRGIVTPETLARVRKIVERFLDDLPR